MTKRVPPEHSDYCKWINEMSWSLPGLLRDYTSTREILRYLRQEGYLSAVITDHELAYKYATRSSSDGDAKKYFDVIMKDGLDRLEGGTE